VGEWLTPRDGRTPGVVVSVAHLDDDERALVLERDDTLPESIRASWQRGSTSDYSNVSRTGR
jgi:hypothetical protein